MTNPKALHGLPALVKATTAGTISPAIIDLPASKTFNTILRGVGACAAVILLEGSNLQDDDSFNTLVTITLSTTDATVSPAKEFGVHNAAWAYIRFTLVSISGTNAAVDTAIGV